jgi:hypothetical protein
VTYREAPAQACICDRPSVATCAACGVARCERHREGELCIGCDKAMVAYVTRKSSFVLVEIIGVTLVFGLASLAWPPLALAMLVVVPVTPLLSTRFQHRHRRARWLRDAKRGALPPGDR